MIHLSDAEIADLCAPLSQPAAQVRYLRTPGLTVPEFLWVNTVLGNLKTSLKGCYHSFAFRKYATRYLSAFAYRFNRRFDLRTLNARLLVARVLPAPPRANDPDG